MNGWLWTHLKWQGEVEFGTALVGLWLFSLLYIGLLYVIVLSVYVIDCFLSMLWDVPMSFASHLYKLR